MKQLFSILACILPVAGLAHDYTLSDLTIAHPIALETTATAMSGAGYMTITNTGNTPDRLIGVEADFPRVMMHETQMTNDIATMVQMDAIDIPAGQTVIFEPGGRHVMFMGLGGDPFEVDEEISVRLVFETAGSIDVVFKVEARDAGDGHSGH